MRKHLLTSVGLRSILSIVLIAVAVIVALVFSVLTACILLLFAFAIWLNEILVEICQDIRNTQ